MNRRRMSDAGLDYQGRYAEIPWVPTRGERLIAVVVVVVCLALCAVGFLVKQ